MKTAMILSAGRGERLRPLTDHCPKPLISVQGRPMIEWHLLQLRRVGVERVVINLHWLAEQFAEQLGTGSRFGLELIYLYESEPLETAGGIAHALPYLGSDPFWLVNGDIFTDYPFDALPFADDAEGELLLVPNPAHHPEGDFGLAGGWLTLKSPTRYTYSGIARFRPEIFSTLPIAPLPLRPLLEALIEKRRLRGALYQGDWTDVGTVERLKAIQ